MVWLWVLVGEHRRVEWWFGFEICGLWVCCLCGNAVVVVKW